MVTGNRQSEVQTAEQILSRIRQTINILTGYLLISLADAHLSSYTTENKRDLSSVYLTPVCVTAKTQIILPPNRQKLIYQLH